MTRGTYAELDIAREFYADVLEQVSEAVWFIGPRRQVVYWNKGAEELTGIRREEVLGKSCCEDILLHIDGLKPEVTSGSHPAAMTLEDGVAREADVYLRHRQGHLVAVHVRSTPLRAADGRIVGVVETLRDNSPRLDELLALQDLAFIDPTTKLASRKYLELRLASRFEEMKRFGWLFGIIMASVDRLEESQAEYGQEMADNLMRMAGKTFANCLRKFDVVGRWGEREFMAVAPILTHSNLFSIGQRVRTVASQAFLHVDSQVLGVTMSVGAAAADKTDTVEQIVERARLWMRQSSAAGGDQVTF